MWLPGPQGKHAFNFYSEKEPMRPGQQNRRSRNRNNSNRKGPNPLSRNYESNGPDVKIRGNAQHVADKYAQLARDASGSGDRVMAENYLQHAEHYNRIIAAAQAQFGVQQQQRDDDDMDDGDDVDTTVAANGQEGDVSAAPQPVLEGTPAEVAIEETEIQSAGFQGERDRDRRPRRRRPFGGDKGRADNADDVNGNVAPEASAERKPRAAEETGADDGSPDGSSIGWLAVAGQD